MERIISNSEGGEIKMIPVKTVSVLSKVAYYTDSTNPEKQTIRENIEDKSYLDTPRCWFYRVRNDAIKRHRSIKDYLFFINHAF